MPIVSPCCTAWALLEILSHVEILSEKAFASLDMMREKKFFSEFIVRLNHVEV